MHYHRILAALDQTELGTVVFEQAMSLAERYQARLKLFHGIPPELMGTMVSVPTDPVWSPGLLETNWESQQRLVDRNLEDAQAFLKHYQDLAHSQGITSEQICQVGDVASYCCQIALTWKADLIVVGRRGRGLLAEAFLGSVSNYIVHHAPCSVLVVQSPHQGSQGV